LFADGVSALRSEHGDDEACDDLRMDYFYQNESEAAAVLPRRFHRSAATLPVTPAAVDPVGDRRRSRKPDQRRTTHVPPSYVEPFAGHRRFITARNDKELYTRSAGYLDEL